MVRCSQNFQAFFSGTYVPFHSNFRLNISQFSASTVFKIPENIRPKIVVLFDSATRIFVVLFERQVPKYTKIKVFLKKSSVNDFSFSLFDRIS